MMALRRTLSAILLLSYCSATASAQDTFQPIPPALAAKYHFDFKRNFFGTPELERADRRHFLAGLAELEKLKGHVADSPANLLRTLKLYDSAQAQFMRHYTSLYAQYVVNTKDTESNQAQSQLNSEFSRRTSFIQQEMMRIESARLKEFEAREPALKSYDFFIQTTRRMRPHTLSLREEELLNGIVPLMVDWPSELYQRSLDRTNWAKVHTPVGDLDVWKDQGSLANSPNREVRETTFKKIHEGYQSSRDLQAFALTKLVRARNLVSRLRHYRSSPDETYFGAYLTGEQVKGLFEKLAQQADFNKRYQRLRAERIRKIAGLPEVKVWDLTVIPPGEERPKFDIVEATQVVKEALAPFGPEYSRELSELLDPGNGRLDIAGGDNRVPGAFAWGFPGSQTSFFYSFTYEGFYDDMVSSLAHESGHAVQFQLMAGNKVKPVYADGPPYFTESFAMFNELLVGDFLYRHAPEGFRKTYFLEQFLGTAIRVFSITRSASLEHSIYEGVAEGKLKGPDDLDALTKKIGSQFSIWFDQQDELKDEWITIHHFFDNPMYYVNYVFANFLAIKYFEMFQRDPKSFVPRYMAMVRNGYDAPPAEILRKFLGLDLKDPKLVSDAFSVLEGRIKTLEEMYSR